jgi:hypothetical protein
MIKPCASDILGFIRECPAALSPLSGDFLSGEVLLRAFVLLSKSGMEASISAVKSVMLFGLLAMIDSLRVRLRAATVLALLVPRTVTNWFKADSEAEDFGDIVVVEANDTRRE